MLLFSIYIKLHNSMIGLSIMAYIKSIVGISYFNNPTPINKLMTVMAEKTQIEISGHFPPIYLKLKHLRK